MDGLVGGPVAWKRRRCADRDQQVYTMRHHSNAWRAEVYGGPHTSVWFVFFALVLILAAAAWCVSDTQASETPEQLSVPDVSTPAASVESSTPAVRIDVQCRQANDDG